MKYRILTVCINLLVLTSISFAQENNKKPLSNNLKPIVQVFGTASYDLGSDYYNYSFGRAHLGFQYNFNSNWSAKIIIDRGRPTIMDVISVIDSSGNVLQFENNTKEGAYYTMFLKFASLRWKVNDKLILESGAILQNHYITQERFWGFRYVSQTFQDKYWKIPSSDLGFMARYKVNNVISIDAALTNGEGPRIEQDALGRIKLAAGIDVFPNSIIQTRLYYHSRLSRAEDSGGEQMVSAFAGIKPTSWLRIGGELNYMNNMNHTVDLNSYGFSVFSSFLIKKNLEMFTRYDRLVYQYNNLSNDNFLDGRSFIGGLSFSPHQGIKLSLNYQTWIPDNSGIDINNRVSFSMEYKI